MHLLITGGAGFIGSHLLEALLRRGDSAVVVDDFSSARRENLPDSVRLQLVEFQLGETTPAELGPIAFDAVVHLAGLPSVTASWKHPVEAHERTLTTTVALLELCRRRSIPRFVFASSAAVYGLPEQLPIGEDALCQPLSPYGLQKLVGEQYLRLFARQMGFSGVVLRLFNVFGPRQAPDSAYSGVISRFVDAFRAGQPIHLFGDGLQTRDFVFVSDVVEAFCAALEVPILPGNTQTFNVGTAHRSSLQDVIAALTRLFPDQKPEIILEPARPGDIPHSQADNSAARQKLGIALAQSLEQGLGSLVDSL